MTIVSTLDRPLKRVMTQGNPVTTVAIIVPCRDEEATITDLLDAIAAQERRPDAVVVVDDGSTDQTVIRIQQWRQLHPELAVSICPSRARGAAAAMNTGISLCQADIIVRLDGHCRPARDYIRACLEALASPGAYVVGGVWEVEPGAATRIARVIATLGGHPLGSGGASYRHAAGPERQDADTVPFGCFHRAVWEGLGGFDEGLLANQDYDFNFRARRAGGKVILSRQIRSVYRARPTLAALARQYARYGYWKMQMLIKSPTRAGGFREGL